MAFGSFVDTDQTTADRNSTRTVALEAETPSGYVWVEQIEDRNHQQLQAGRYSAADTAVDMAHSVVGAVSAHSIAYRAARPNKAVVDMAHRKLHRDPGLVSIFELLLSPLNAQKTPLVAAEASAAEIESAAGESRTY